MRVQLLEDGAMSQVVCGEIPVLAETAYPDVVAGSRVRIVEMGAELGRHGVSLSFSPTITNEEYRLISQPGASPRKIAALALGSARAVRRDVSSLRLVHRLRSLLPTPADRARLDVYDFDDALYVGSLSSHRSQLSTLKREAARCVQYMRGARIVLAGNSVLASEAARHAERVEIVPSCVDPSLQPMRNHQEAETLTLGWVGSSTTTPYLAPALEAVDTLYRRGRRLKLILMGAQTSVRAPWIEHRTWSVEAERALLAELDIGLMPLPDNAWTRGKCGYKLLRYFSAGLPAIASPVGINFRLVADGRGIAAESVPDWCDAIEQLAEGAAARRQIGATARTYVEQEYSYAVWGPRVADLLGSLI